jgi:hypothetical protein
LKDAAGLVQVYHRRSDEHHQVVGIQRGTMRNLDYPEALEQQPLIELADHGMQDLHD